MSEWKTIDSAPKDGSSFYVCGWDWGKEGGQRHIAFVRFVEGVWCSVDGTLAWQYLTHWLPPPVIPPLPTTPTLQVNQEKD